MGLEKVYLQLGTLFLLMLLGYVVAKVKWITEEGVQAFSQFVVKVALPMVIVSSMIIPLTPEKSKQAMQMLVLAIISYTAVCVLAFILPKFMTKEKDEMGAYAFGIVFSNSGFMGFPVLDAIFGKEAIFLASIHNIIFNILVFTLGIKLIQTGKNKKAKFNLKALVNPGTIASLIGLVIFFTGIKLPEVITSSIELVGGLCTPLSMITIGAMLAALPVGQMFSTKGIYFLTFVRLAVAPILVFFIIRYGIGIQDRLLLGIPVVIAGMPVAANSAMMMNQYGDKPELASQGIFVSTLFSCVTIPLLLILLRY